MKSNLNKEMTPKTYYFTYDCKGTIKLGMLIEGEEEPMNRFNWLSRLFTSYEI